MHYNALSVGGKPPKLPLPLGISSPCRKRAEPQPEATCRTNLVKIAHVVPEISCHTDTETDRWMLLIVILRHHSRRQSNNLVKKRTDFNNVWYTKS